MTASSIDTLAIQARLRTLGFDPGPLDGIRGRRTIAAVKAFQKRRRITVDGLVGPQTLARLWPAGTPAPAHTPAPELTPWMDEARARLGMHEKTHRQSLMQWLRSDGRTLGDPARLPWCGDFVQTCLALTLPDEPLPANPWGARNWASFGKACTPQDGAVLVFWRGSPRGWAGHVGFCVGESAAAYRVLGGNQSNAVTIANVSKRRLLTARWPTTALPPGGHMTEAAAGGGLSTNEA